MENASKEVAVTDRSAGSPEDSVVATTCKSPTRILLVDDSLAFRERLAREGAEGLPESQSTHRNGRVVGPCPGGIDM